MQWTEMKSEADEPGDDLLSKVGRCKFLCAVAYSGTMIVVRGMDVVMFDKSRGFLLADKGELKAGVTHWMPLPEMPE